jgi:hypothetical protein
MSSTGTASLTINELREFSEFSACEQRYIKRSLDIGLGRRDAFQVWARDSDEAASIRRQYIAYQNLKLLRAMLREEDGLDGLGDFLAKLVAMTTFDLAQGRLTTFSAYRFLYERLLGAWSRPWLPGAFCGAAALPQIRPERRKSLLRSISEAAATAPGWSDREPSFYPECVDKVAA